MDWDKAKWDLDKIAQQAKSGDAVALFKLGVLAKDERDLYGAALCCLRAAELGNADALYELVLLAEEVARDYGDLDSARDWCRRACELGSMDALDLLRSLGG